MAFVIAETCIDVKDGVCTEVCPVDCIYEGGRMFYIQPDECIDCALCVSVCPVEAIYPDDRIPEQYRPYIAINAEFFEDKVTGWGSPRGFEPEYRTDKDHPLVEKIERRDI
ncbi:MAG: ferredoxin family protein [Alphaproteobacteria bacterium]|nr:ferredoxin family protein [Alphaproteobacteria bacterium]